MNTILKRQEHSYGETRDTRYPPVKQSYKQGNRDGLIGDSPFILLAVCWLCAGFLLAKSDQVTPLFLPEMLPTKKKGKQPFCSGHTALTYTPGHIRSSD